MPSRLAEDGRWSFSVLSVFSEAVMMKIVGSLYAGEGWAMDLRFPFVFSEDVTI